MTGSVRRSRLLRCHTVQELVVHVLDDASGHVSYGTADLGPETGLGVDASLKGDYANASFEISPYLNDINHFIFGFLRGDTIQSFPVRQFTATDARLWGLDDSGSVQPAQYLSIKAAAD